MSDDTRKFPMYGTDDIDRNAIYEHKNKAHNSGTDEAGLVGSSGLLVPASPAPTARPDRFTAGPIGAHQNQILYKTGFVCCEHNYHCETIEFMVRHCKKEHH